MGIENPVHLVFVAVVALLVLGPKRLPELARTLGNGVREFRKAVDFAGSDDRSQQPVYGPQPSAPAPEPVPQQFAQANMTSPYDTVQQQPIITTAPTVHAATQGAESAPVVEAATPVVPAPAPVAPVAERAPAPTASVTQQLADAQGQPAPDEQSRT